MNSVVSPENAVKEVVSKWTRIEEIIEFAIKRHGFGDSNGGFGITYWSDLDEYDKLKDEQNIPDGSIEVYGYWGPPNGYRLIVTERFYLDSLCEILESESLLNLKQRLCQYTKHIL